jgi:tetratricopeptide (TPR) repeat protein
LAAAWSALGYDEKARVEAKRAFELSHTFSKEERLLIAARYREMSREWDKAVEAYQLLFLSFPDNVDDGIRLMQAQTSFIGQARLLALRLRQTNIRLRRDRGEVSRPCDTDLCIGGNQVLFGLANVRPSLQQR